MKKIVNNYALFMSSDKTGIVENSVHDSDKIIAGPQGQ